MFRGHMGQDAVRHFRPAVLGHIFSPVFQIKRLILRFAAMFHTVQINIIITDDLAGDDADPSPSPDQNIAIAMFLQYGDQIRPDTLQVGSTR